MRVDGVMAQWQSTGGSSQRCPAVAVSELSGYPGTRHARRVQ